MTKTFFKELIIVLLLCLAIILLLGILLYEYVPMTKTLPNPVSYKTSEEVKQQLTESSSINEDQVILTYEIDSNDLNNFKRVQNYKPGKANPFSSYEVNSSNGTNPEQNGSSNSSGNTSTGNTSSGTNTNNNTTSGGTFFQNKGTK